MSFPEKDPLNTVSPIHSFNAKHKITTSTIIAPPTELMMLSKSADILIKDIPDDFAPLTESILSAKQIYQGLMVPNIDLTEIQKETRKLTENSNISAKEAAKLIELLRDQKFVDKMRELGDKSVKLEQKTFLAGGSKENKKVMLLTARSIINACNWGTSGSSADFLRFKGSVLSIDKEVKNIVIKTNAIPIIEEDRKPELVVEKEPRASYSVADQSEFDYLTNNPNEGRVKTILGEEEIVSDKYFAPFVSPSGKTQSLSLIKTKIKNGGSRHIIKIENINVAAALLDKNNKITATYIDNYLRKTDILDKLFLSVNIF